MIDIHSHILPGVDDGASDMKTSLEMCEISVNDGVTVMAATPHMLDGTYNVERETIISGVKELQKELDKNNINLRVVPGADIHINVDFVNLNKSGGIVTLNDTGKYALIEFPPLIIPHKVDEFLFSMQINGITPVITHPERNQSVQKHPEQTLKWAQSGNIIQMTAASITGELGKEAKECSMKLLEAGLVHVIASDSHSPTWRAPGLSEARAIIAELISEEEADLTTKHRPESIINGNSIDLPEPKEIMTAKNKHWFFKWFSK